MQSKDPQNSQASCNLCKKPYYAPALNQNLLCRRPFQDLSANLLRFLTGNRRKISKTLHRSTKKYNERIGGDTTWPTTHRSLDSSNGTWSDWRRSRAFVASKSGKMAPLTQLLLRYQLPYSVWGSVQSNNVDRLWEVSPDTQGRLLWRAVKKIKELESVQH